MASGPDSGHQLKSKKSSSTSPLNSTVDEATAATPAAPAVSLRGDKPRAVRVEGLAETLQRVRHELDLISHASKFDWINKRLIVLRNAIIACVALGGVIVLSALCFHEAYRQTLNISAFDVPEQLAEQGITGKIVAKALFDELIKRRRTITTLDAGDLREGWLAHETDVAIPETHFTLDSVFRYLRHLTGNEILVDGEVLIVGEDIMIKARVAGNPPRVIRGKRGEWESLVSELANYVYDTTQPAVLASYLGLTAKTPQELVELSRYVVKMANTTPRLPRNVMAIAYDAYGGALMRQDNLTAALAAFNQAMYYDPKAGLPVMDAAEVNFRLGNVKEAARLYQRAGNMPIGDAAKQAALRRRVSGAMNSGDCVAGGAAIRQAQEFSRYDEQWERWMEARFLMSCEYEEGKADDIVRSIANLHPDSGNAWVYFSLIMADRKGEKYLREAADGAQRAIDNSTEPRGILTYFAHINLASYLAHLGDIKGAMATYEKARDIVKADRPDLRNTLAEIRYYANDFAGAEAILRPLIATEEGRRGDAYEILGLSLAKQGRSKEAIEILRAGQKEFPTSCTLYDTSGHLLLDAGRVAEALAEFERGISAAKKCGLPYISEARALIASHRIAEARGKLNELMAVSPRSDAAHEARDILAGLVNTKATK